ncbi:hypothetical protein CEXT_130461 [Caerostris extrusa]|uniref:Uncharacterized protein n=1 Tax=Caerostris extrusa TaxID=172846 RepID=A0AAV4N980_CAEEX|nr:hypothetical protein CEXT_130461 [Caerostris extrusa]
MFRIHFKPGPDGLRPSGKGIDVRPSGFKGLMAEWLALGAIDKERCRPPRMSGGGEWGLLRRSTTTRLGKCNRSE